MTIIKLSTAVKLVDSEDGDGDNLLVVGPDSDGDYRIVDTEDQFEDGEYVDGDFASNVRDVAVIELGKVEHTGDNTFTVNGVPAYYPTPESVGATVAAGAHALAVQLFVQDHEKEQALVKANAALAARKKFEEMMLTSVYARLVIDEAAAAGVLTIND